MTAPSSIASPAQAPSADPADSTGLVPRLRLLPPPRWATEDPPDRSVVPGQQVLALEFLLPNGLPAVPQTQCLQNSGSSQPDITPWAARLAQAVLEVEAAERPVMQLYRWVMPDIYRRLDRRQQLRTRQLDTHIPRGRSAEHVRSVHVCHPRPGVAEVSVVTAGAERCRALALRLERRKERWMCTALDWA